MRDDFEITVPQVDLAVETARAAGALGARMTGGGFGGCIIALVRRARWSEGGRSPTVSRTPDFPARTLRCPSIGRALTASSELRKSFRSDSKPTGIDQLRHRGRIQSSGPIRR